VGQRLVAVSAGGELAALVALFSRTIFADRGLAQEIAGDRAEVLVVLEDGVFGQHAAEVSERIDE